MYQVQEIVIHPTAGVCRILSIQEKNFAGDAPRPYYQLEPIYEECPTAIYVPVDCEKIKLRLPLSREEINDLIHNASLKNPLWVDNDAARKEKFMGILRNGDEKALLQLVVELHRKQEEVIALGRKFHMADQRILQEAEKRIHQEICYAISLRPDEVASFVKKELGLHQE